MNKCENCSGEIKETWGFQVTGDGIHCKDYYFCSEECGNEYAKKLMHKYVELKNLAETGTR